MSVFNSLTENKIIILLGCYVFFLLIICSHMSPLYYSNEWADVNIYFNVAKAMFNGRTLYTESFDHKGPLIFFIYGLGYLISNNSFFGMFLIQWTAWFIMVYYIYKLSKLYLDNAFAYIVAIIFPVFILKIMKAGGSAEEFILVFECISLYYFVRYFKGKGVSIHKPSVMFIHGIMCSMVLFIKLNLLAFWFFPLAAIFFNLLRKRAFKNFAVNMVAYIAGLLIIATPILLYLYVNDALQEAYSIYIELNRKYAELQTISSSVQLVLLRVVYLFMDPFALFFMALIGVFYFPVKHIKYTLGKYALLLSGVALYIIIFMSPVFQMYYPVVFLIFSLLGVLSLFIYISGFITIVKYITSAFLLIITSCMIYIGYSQTDLGNSKIAGTTVSLKPGLLTQKIHDEIVKEPNPTLLNVGFGLGNSLFTTCKIVPNIRYFVSPNLTYESYPQMRDEQTRYIENKEIKFIVIPLPLLDIDGSTKVQKRRKIGNQEYFLNLRAFKENYTLILTDTIINTIDEKNIEILQLYKLK